MPATDVEQSIFDVSVVYNIDAGQWPQHICKQLSPSLRARLILDTELPTVRPPITDSKVVIVVASYGHVTFLQSANSSHYADVEADSGIIFMCGVEEHHLAEQPADQNASSWAPGSKGGPGRSRPASESFPTFSRWMQVPYQVSSTELRKTVDRLVSAWEPSKVKVHPTSAHCETPTSIVLSFTDAVHPDDAMVDVLMSDKQHGDSVCVKLHTTRLNPYTYTFEAPEHRPGTVGIKVLVDETLVSRSLTLRYAPTTSGTVKNISHIYMHLLNTLCLKVLSDDVPTTGRRSHTSDFQTTKTELDLKLSSMLDAEDSLVFIPVQAFEQLFGVNKFAAIGEVHDCELPTLIHLAAKFGLQELCAKLSDLPDASCAFSIANESGQYPQEIARANGHGELADFLETLQETSDFDSYVTRYENDKMAPHSSSRYYVNVKGTSEVQECLYMAMDKCSQLDDIYEDTDRDEAEVYEVCPSIASSTDTNMSARQKKLVGIMDLVKNGDINIGQAEILFRDWQIQHERGRNAKSFKDKQAELQNMKSFISDAKNQVTTNRRPNAVQGGALNQLIVGTSNIAQRHLLHHSASAAGSRDSDSSLSSRTSTLSSTSSRTSRASVQSTSEGDDNSLPSPGVSGRPQVPPRSSGVGKPFGTVGKK